MNYVKKALIALAIAASMAPAVSQAKGAAHLATGIATGVIFGSSMNRYSSTSQIASVCRLKAKANISLDEEEQRLCEAAIDTVSTHNYIMLTIILLVVGGLGFWIFGIPAINNYIDDQYDKQQEKEREERRKQAAIESATRNQVLIAERQMKEAEAAVEAAELSKVEAEMIAAAEKIKEAKHKLLLAETEEQKHERLVQEKEDRRIAEIAIDHEGLRKLPYKGPEFMKLLNTLQTNKA